MPPAAGHADAHRIDAVAIRAQQLAGRRSESGIIEYFDESLDVVGLEKAIGIDELHEFAPRRGDALIHSRRDSAIRLIANGRDLGRFVRRRVVDHDQLDVAMDLLPDSIEAAAQVLPAVPGYEDDRDGSCHLSIAFFSTAVYARNASRRSMPRGRIPKMPAINRSTMPTMITHRSISACPGRSHFRA